MEKGKDFKCEIKEFNNEKDLLELLKWNALFRIGKCL